MPPYTVLLHQDAVAKLHAYINRLSAGEEPGKRVQKQLAERAPDAIDTKDWIELLLRTKLPQIFAESQISGDGSDWTLEELSLLGDIGIATPVTIFDNGLHYDPDIHETPLEGHLLFIPGALLRSNGSAPPADWREAISEGDIDQDAYSGLYERRLLPLLMYANAQVESVGKKALITIPGLGCGQFAGRFRGQLGAALEKALCTLLEKHAHALPHIRCVYYDPYQECANRSYEYDGISLRVRPLTQGNQDKPQLCYPEEYETTKDEFSDCELFSVVAWDHVSWPGNDFYGGARATDDGVKAAATSAMFVMTGVEGEYNTIRNCYDPPATYQDWQAVVTKENKQLTIDGNLRFYPVQEETKETKEPDKTVESVENEDAPTAPEVKEPKEISESTASTNEESKEPTKAPNAPKDDAEASANEATEDAPTNADESKATTETPKETTSTDTKEDKATGGVVDSETQPDKATTDAVIDGKKSQLPAAQPGLIQRFIQWLMALFGGNKR